MKKSFVMTATILGVTGAMMVTGCRGHEKRAEARQSAWTEDKVNITGNAGNKHYGFKGDVNEQARSLAADSSWRSEGREPASTATDSKHKATKKSNTMHSQSAAVDAEASFVTEITFEKGSKDLSADSKNRLKSLVDRARQTGKIDDIKIITWSDMEYPSLNVKKLSKEQRDLAKNRNDTLKDYLKSGEVDVSDVDAFNMAERPNALERLLRTEDARIKRSLEAAGIPTTDSYVKVPAKASKSVVMVVLED